MVILAKYNVTYAHSCVGESIWVVDDNFNYAIYRASIIRDMLHYDNTSFQRGYNLGL